MQKIVLIRHGESVFNQENRFTGWEDVDLSDKGCEQARQAGKLLNKNGYNFDVGFTSYLKRSIKTLHYILEELDHLWIPVEKSWRLNERFYGALQGLNKDETIAKYGAEAGAKMANETPTSTHLLLLKMIRVIRGMTYGINILPSANYR